MASLESVLVVGGGGREATLMAEALQSDVGTVYSTRGEDAVNIGLEGVVNTGVGEDPKNVRDFAVDNDVSLVIVGPEKPLINGVSDLLRRDGVHVYGPGVDGARFEDNKVETHEFVERHGLPNPPESATFTPEQAEDAKDMIRSLGVANIFTKRVGQEGGKGAKGYDEDELEAAEAEVDAVAKKGEDLLIQGRLRGPEYSAMFMLDGKGHAVALPLSRDHKALYDGGKGPNTGGMGAFSPLAAEHVSMGRRIDIQQIGEQFVAGLAADGVDYRGTVYLGLMAFNTHARRSPLYLLEANVRFGDPETQVLLQSLGGHAIEYMYLAATGEVEDDYSRIYNASGRVALTVCLASPGYAQEGAEQITGLPIHVPEELPDDVSIQFAGAKMVDGKPVSSGGRVLYVTKTAGSLEAARGVYDYIGREKDGVYIGDDQQVIRTDIGLS